uniref:Zinc finger protein 180 n=1 Tax=Mus musculus TaxID=10090 RepID=A0A0U1RQ26_MOUSE
MEQQDDESLESLQACVETCQLYMEQKEPPQSRQSSMKNHPMD